MSHDAAGVTVTGSASVDVEPDIVVAEIGVDVREPDVTTALAAAEAALEKMRAALLEAGVARADLRSGQTSIWREDRTSERGELLATVVHVTLGLRATFRDVGTAGERVHAALAAAGPAAQMNSLAFAVSDASTALARARAGAFDDATQVAQGYAARAGRSLGAVTAIVETPDGLAPRVHRAKLTADAAYAGSVPVEPGQQSVSASVRVTWLLAD